MATEPAGVDPLMAQCLELTKKTIDELKNASTEFDYIQLELTSLKSTLNSLDDLRKCPTSTPHSASHDRQVQLKLLLQNCKRDLEHVRVTVDMAKVLNFEIEGVDVNTVARLLMFATANDKLGVHKTAIKDFTTSLSYDSIGPLEQLLMNANLASTLSPPTSPAIPSTTVTTQPRDTTPAGDNGAASTRDVGQVWTRIAREMASEGITDDDLEKVEEEVKKTLRCLLLGKETDGQSEDGQDSPESCGPLTETDESEGWSAETPGSIANDPLSPDEVVDRAATAWAALDHITIPGCFDWVCQEILSLVGDGITVRQIGELVFEKAVDEAGNAAPCARLCKFMLDTMSPDIIDTYHTTGRDRNGNFVAGGRLFQKYTLNICQEEFKRGWNTATSNLETGTVEGPAVDELRGLGVVRFIGELFKQGLLPEHVMHECVRSLLDFEGVDVPKIKSLKTLLQVAGGALDATAATRKDKTYMDAYICRIANVAHRPGIDIDLQNLLLDLIALRRADWRVW